MLKIIERIIGERFMEALNKVVVYVPVTYSSDLVYSSEARMCGFSSGVVSSERIRISNILGGYC